MGAATKSSSWPNWFGRRGAGVRPGFRRATGHAVFATGIFVGMLYGAVVGSAAEPAFNRDIRPILSEYCFQCHGPDEATREAGLRLDQRAAALAERDGQPAIVPGHPDQSLIVERILATDKEVQMPPPETGKRLSQAQIEILRQWIANGAEYQQHWAFEPVQRPSLPNVTQTDWARNPIDRFILATLEQHSLSPSQEADRATLIRRLYLDLLGLPPSVTDVRQFLEDDQPAAYERLVDRVLASPRFGERWGRHWLDQARYADSHGYTNDNERVMWPYRDWVIAAFNRDLPFDLFTIEQLAGDLLAETPESGRPLASTSLDALIATGFHRNTLINTEGGTKADQFRDEQVKDRVDTTGSVWLALTVGCAKCHSHKYDPISQPEYYQLYSFFNSTSDNNSIPPTVKAPTFIQRQREQDLVEKKAELESLIENHPGREQRRQAWEQALVASGPQRSGDQDSGTGTAESDPWTVLKLDGKSRAGARLTPQPDLSLLASGANEGGDEYQVTALAPLTKIRSVRLETLTDPSLPGQGPGRAANGNFVVSEFWFRTGDGRELRFAKATADHSQKNYEVSGAIDNNASTGWAVNGSNDGVLNQKRTAWFVLPQPLEVEANHALTFTLQFNAGANAYNLGRFRLSLLADEWVDVPTREELVRIAATAPSERSQDQQRRLEDGFLREDADLAASFKELEQVKQQLEQLLAEVPSTMVMEELPTPRPTHLQIRGDFLRLGDALMADVPRVLPPLRRATQPTSATLPSRSTPTAGAATKEPVPREASTTTTSTASDPNSTNAVPSTATSSGTTGNTESASPRLRLDLARWLVRNDHPLTPRVQVNRAWMRLFGTGLVETENDFGMQGALPMHPELLDWLAAEWVEREWSTKQLLRLITTSATYRQSSSGPTPEMPAALRLAAERATQQDPLNRWLWRQNRVRVEAEIVRDLGLAASGLLSNKLGGPSVFPPQPAGVYAFTQRVQNWRTSQGEDRYRRGMYTFFFRSAPYPMLSTFDVPNFNQACTRRDRSNTPLQALTVANDATMVEIAQSLARRPERDLPAVTPLATRVTYLFQRAMSREPSEAERKVLENFWQTQQEAFTGQPEAAQKVTGGSSDPGQAAWVATARVLLNLDEFITRE